jgi:hypothetical protein
MKKIKINYRVITPGNLADLDSFIHPDTQCHKSIDTKEEAVMAIDNFGTTDVNSEYFTYNETVRKQCKIVKVTTIIDDDLDSENNYHVCDEALSILKTIANYSNATVEMPPKMYDKLIDVINNSNV